VQGVQVDLVAQPGPEGLDEPGGVVAGPVEAAVDRLLDAAAERGQPPGGGEQQHEPSRATETTGLVGDFDGDGKSFTDGLEAARRPMRPQHPRPGSRSSGSDLGIPVYSDEPFPPLASTAATLETPTFSKRRRHAARIAGRSEGSTR
jgi:hypothetical protein